MVASPAMADTAPDAAPDALSALFARLRRELEQLPTRAHLTDADAQALYALAYREYGQARHEEALRYFQLLLVYRATDPVYLLGLALCLQRLRRYEHAEAAYSALTLLEPREPSYRLALAECQLLRHEHGVARQTLEIVTTLCAESGAHEQVLARAQAMLQLLRSEHVDPAV